MASTLDLQQRAVEFAKAGNFGSEALEANLQLTRLDPGNHGAWTRLARCYMELGQLDEASAALEAALALNPQNTIARNLQGEVTRRRVGVTAAAPRAAKPARGSKDAVKVPRGDGARFTGGFGRAEFMALGQLPPAVAVEALGPRIEALLMALNERQFADKAVETRNRAGRAGARLFRRNSFHAESPGHVSAFHHGGRWEPQLNIGLFAAPQWGRDSMRAGIGFNLTPDGSDPEREAGQERVLASFVHFQQLVSSAWRNLLVDWMGANAGFIQHGPRRAPDTDLLPRDAVAWLVNCQNAADVGWVFVGRWLFADRPADADTLADQRKLVAWSEESFNALMPLWTSLFRR